MLEETFQLQELQHIFLKEIFMQLITELEIIYMKLQNPEYSSKTLVKDYFQTPLDFGPLSKKQIKYDVVTYLSRLHPNINAIKRQFAAKKDNFNDLSANTYDPNIKKSIYINANAAIKFLSENHSIFSLNAKFFKQLPQVCQCIKNNMIPDLCQFCQMGFKRKLMVFQNNFFKNQNYFQKKYKSQLAQIYTLQKDPTYEKLFFTIQKLKEEIRYQQSQHLQQQTFTFLIQNNYINIQNKQYQQVLDFVVKKGNLKLIKIILKNIQNEDLRQQFLQRVLFKSCLYQQQEILRYVMQYNMNPNGVDEQNNNVIQSCVDNRIFRIRNFMLCYDFNFDTQDSYGMTPLMKMCGYVKTSSVEKILRKQVNVNQKSLHGFSPLNISCYIGSEKIIKMLLKKGVDVNQRCQLGFTPMMYACMRSKYILDKLYEKMSQDELNYFSVRIFLRDNFNKDCVKIIKLLLKNGAEIDFQSKEGYTALMIAAISGYPQTVQFLLQKGAFINKSLFNTQITALHKTLQFYGYSQLEESDYEDLENKQNTYTVEKARFYLEIAKILVQTNIQQDNECNHWGILVQACTYDYVHFVNVVLENSDIDISLVDNQSRTLFTISCMKKSLRCAGLIYKQISDDVRKIKDKDGSEAFDYLTGQEQQFVKDYVVEELEQSQSGEESLDDTYFENFDTELSQKPKIIDPSQLQDVERILQVQDFVEIYDEEDSEDFELSDDSLEDENFQLETEQ